MTNEDVLFLSHRIPYPPDKGDKIRSWAWLKYFAAKYRVHLACFVDDPRDFAHQEFLSSICASVALVPLSQRWSRIRSLTALGSGRPLSFHYFNSPQMKEAVAAARTKPLVMEFAFSSAMAPFIEAPINGSKRIVDFCDADSEKWMQYARSAPLLLKQIYAREGRLLAEAELHIAQWADACFAVSDAEAAVFNQRLALDKHVSSLPNGVDADYFAPSNAKPDDAVRSDLVFVGAMDYRANIEGVLHFVETIWPQIRAARPDVRFSIVGANPVVKILALDGENGVRVTGRVDDVRPWLANAKIVIAPLLVARGVQNKVLEAMAMQKPVVASNEAMTGVNAPQNAAVTVRNDEAMAQETLTLLNEPQRRAAIGESARKFVVENFSWSASYATLDAALEKLNLYSSSSPGQAEKAGPPISATR